MMLTPLHIVYMLCVLVILTVMACRKDIILPCILSLLLVGVWSSRSLIAGVQLIYNALITAGNEFLGVIVIISLVVAMSKSLREIGADVIMLRPIQKIMKGRTMSFFGLGFVMLLVSWVIWPSPAVALVGALMLPAAIAAGLPAIWAAVAMNLFGHGIGLSSDFFIQGAPSISAKAAGMEDPSMIISATVIPWVVMSVVTVAVAYVLMRRDLTKKPPKPVEAKKAGSEKANPMHKQAVLVAILTPVAFLIDLVLMFRYQLRGGDATALVGGTAVLIMCIVTLIQHRLNGLEIVSDNVRDGFMFGIKIYAPVIIIGAFFFLGGEGSAATLFGADTASQGIFSDIGAFMASRIAMTKFPVTMMQSLVAVLAGMDGSGFSGLPLLGSLAQTFNNVLPGTLARLTALGQLITIWVGGGTVIPWSVIPVAAICGVDAVDLARKNFIPVTCGIVAAVVTTLFLL